MPIYEYQCQKCAKITEATQKFSDKPLTKCPLCAGRLNKLISNCSFQLKGSGWYVTDYGKKDSGRRPKEGESKTVESKAEKVESKAEKVESKAEKMESKAEKMESKAEKNP